MTEAPREGRRSILTHVSAVVLSFRLHTPALAAVLCDDLPDAAWREGADAVEGRAAGERRDEGDRGGVRIEGIGGGGDSCQLEDGLTSCTPAARIASSSSPPRPKTKGSPPFNRTTR